MDMQISTKANQNKIKMLKHSFQNQKNTARKLLSGEKGSITTPPAKGVSDKERTYFEYLIQNEPLLQDYIGMLIDGDALPIDYSSKSVVPSENTSQIQWGRVVRNISQTINFERVERDVVEGSITTMLEGAVKISAPYHLSRRKHHAVLFKPFKETCIRKAYFQRRGNTSDVAKAWKLVAVSAGKGGTEDNDVEIEALELRWGENGQYQIQSPFNHPFTFNQDDAPAHQSVANNDFRIELKVRSNEMEQNMIVVRSLLEGEGTQRKQLLFQTDTREEGNYCQTYLGTFPTGIEQRVHNLVVEAVLRSSLYDTGAPVCTSFWVFPAIIQ